MTRDDEARCGTWASGEVGDFGFGFDGLAEGRVRCPLLTVSRIGSWVTKNTVISSSLSKPHDLTTPIKPTRRSSMSG